MLGLLTLAEWAGVIRSLCEIMESGQRPKMMPLIPEIWSQTLGLLATRVAAGSVISRQLIFLPALKGCLIQHRQLDALIH